jgi:hypothetical protein
MILSCLEVHYGLFDLSYPSDTTTPDPSIPGVKGYEPVGYRPYNVITSEGLSGAESTLIRTWEADWTGTGTSSRV